MDLLEGFVGLLAFIAFLACLGKVGDTLSALEKPSVVTDGSAVTAGHAKARPMTSGARFSECPFFLSTDQSLYQVDN